MLRRDFLKQAFLLSAGSLLLPSFLSATRRQQLRPEFKGKRLIIIQLSGGNDGLNTIVPFTNDVYYQSRPQIAIAASEVSKLNDNQGLNPVLLPLRPLYDNGEWLLLNNVGYPNPDRSHFRSLDIWHTASDANEYLSTGWLGRYLDGFSTDIPAHHALELDDSLTLALKGVEHNGFALSKTEGLKRGMKNPLVQNALHSDHTHPHSDNLAYLYKVLENTDASADYLMQKLQPQKTTATYPQQAFGRDLQQVAQLVAAGCETQIYYVSLTGFDTHANQKTRQEQLLKLYADAVAALIADLKAANEWSNTLIFTFSEFGRRVKENGSRGTDHGTANVAFLMSGALKKAGIYNAAPDLVNLSDGDLIYHLDFRTIYATLLDKWLQTNSQAILNKQFHALEVF